MAKAALNLGISRLISSAPCELTDQIQDVVGYSGHLSFASSKPDGTPQHILNICRLKELWWQACITLRAGLTDIYREFADVSAAGKASE